MNKSSGLATTSMILGILGFCCCGFATALPAIICGHIALSQIKKGEAEGRGMAVAGLVLGYTSIVLTVIAIIVYFILLATGIAIPFLHHERMW